MSQLFASKLNIEFLLRQVSLSCVCEDFFLTLAESLYLPADKPPSG